MQFNPFARQLRQRLTDAELRLWYHLRDRRCLGVKFRRQYPIGPYVVDFVAISRNLIVEVDGSQHLDSRSDAERDRYLREKGFRVLRFWNHEVLQQTEAVLERLHEALT